MFTKTSIAVWCNTENVPHVRIFSYLLNVIQWAAICLILQIPKVLFHGMFKRLQCFSGGKYEIVQLPQKITIEQYYCIKETASSEFKVLSRDRVSNIPYKMRADVHVFLGLYSWFQYLEHRKFLEYVLGVLHEGVRNADDKGSNFDVI